MTAERIQRAYEAVRTRLLDERNAAGHWRGELASSALSTATAISALCETARQRRDPTAWQDLIENGCGWLDRHQNDDGGWGDTDRSHSNIATTMLVRAAFRLVESLTCKLGPDRTAALERASQYIAEQGEVEGLRRRYGKDKTFAVPILSNCAIAGLADWRDVSPLPFELAVFPQSMYRFLQMPVVSYAIPALVAIGQARHFLRPSRWPWMRWLRSAAVAPSLRVLLRMQPDSGGYLEATPLTSFVVMNLSASGRASHPVVDAGIRFLIDSVRADGSWPIDTDLATWNTTLSINALAAAGEDVVQLNCLPWLLECQHRQRHPFTGADPGGWGWTDLSGAVPDADDTPGALLALNAWRQSSGYAPQQDESEALEAAAREGMRWLLDLQNRDGGWPTFCRGWGKLPFDRSGSDLTAHALRALMAWQDRWAEWRLDRQHGGKYAIRSKIEAGIRYLERQQRPDGSWIPLWFGNQDHPLEENPVYGTSKVLLLEQAGLELPGAAAGREFLRNMQNPDGGWGSTTGGPSSVEETALAVDALQLDSSDSAVQDGIHYLVQAVELATERDHWEAAPIGFYFAKLWYHERLYPLIFAAQTLGRAARTTSPHQPICG
ncbi:MAG: squalene--hopene cyclase [Planctomycetales bacterium]|nr:squalene--hopene cyclase [Planctomycetales bacterium]